ncbi:MAG TPA: hypothetical protein EYP10_02890, partial [Armatimonadetes bacterium]|nr:hypothetical protein [Armatimonadota bacterium]
TPPPKENIIRIFTDRAGQIFFAPEDAIVKLRVVKPNLRSNALWRVRVTDLWGNVVLEREIECDTNEIAQVRFGGLGYFDMHVQLCDARGVVRERKFSVGIVNPLSPKDDAVTSEAPFGIWVGGYGLPKKIGIRWGRRYCQPWDFEPRGEAYRWLRHPDEPFELRLPNGKLSWVTYFRGMPKWLTRRPDRPDFLKFPPKDWNEYARFIQWYVSRTKDKLKVWEVWNEPVPYAYWMGTVEEVVKLHEVTYKAVHTADPNAVVIGPCPYTFVWWFLERFFELGGAKWIDAISIHTYRPHSDSPEGTNFAGDLERLRKLLKPYPHLRDIYITEMGYASWAVGEVRQADYLVRTIVIALAHGVRVIIWHMFWDWNDKDLEGGHGILRYDHTPKPALVAYAVLINQLMRAKFIGEVAGLPQKCMGYRFAKDGNEIWVLWCWGEEPVTVRLPIAKRFIRAVNIMGVNDKVQVEDDAVRITLTEHPKYVWLRIANDD